MYKLTDRESIMSYLPKHTSKVVSDEIVNLVKNMGESIDIPQEYLEGSFIEQMPVMRGMRIGLREYINAIKYCNLKMGNYSTTEAWKKVFPDKYDILVGKGKEHQLSSHVSIYNKSVLVTKIEANLYTGMHIQYAPAVHEAIQKNIQLMRGIAAPSRIPLTKKTSVQV